MPIQQVADRLFSYLIENKIDIIPPIKNKNYGTSQLGSFLKTQVMLKKLKKMVYMNLLPFFILTSSTNCLIFCSLSRRQINSTLSLSTTM